MGMQIKSQMCLETSAINPVSAWCANSVAGGALVGDDDAAASKMCERATVFG